MPADATALVGFSFADDGPSSADWEGFPAAVAVVPEITVTRAAGRSRLTIAVPPGSDGQLLLAVASTLRPQTTPVLTREVDHTVESRPSPHDWVGLVAEAVAAIRGRSDAKVVLARSVSMVGGIVRAFELVAILRDRYPECRVFGWQEGDATFVGASPELLVARRGIISGWRRWPAPLGGEATPRRTADSVTPCSPPPRIGSEHELVVEDAVHRLSAGHDRRAVADPPAAALSPRCSTWRHRSTGPPPPVSWIWRRRSTRRPPSAVRREPRLSASSTRWRGSTAGWYAGGIGWADACG